MGREGYPEVPAGRKSIPVLKGKPWDRSGAYVLALALSLGRTQVNIRISGHDPQAMILGTTYMKSVGCLNTFVDPGLCPVNNSGDLLPFY